MKVQHTGRVGAPTRRRRRLAVVATALVAAMALGACGDDDEGGSSASGGGSDEASKPALKIMVNTPETSAADLSFPMDVEVAKAFEATVKEQGGVGGRPLEIVYCDDKSDPNQAAACARKAVQEKVAAAVGFSYVGDSIVPTLNKAGIAWLPTTAGSEAENTSPNSFPITASYMATVGNGILAGNSCESATMLSAEFAGAAFILTLQQLGQAAVGEPALVTKDDYITYPATTKDFGPIVAKAMKSNPDCLVLPISSQAALGIYDALQAAGQTPKIIGNQGTTVTNESIKRFPEQTDGARLSGLVSDWDLPAWEDYRAAIEKHADPELDYEGIQPQSMWLALTAITNVAAEMDGEIDAKKMMAQLNTSTNVSLGDKAPPLDFTGEFPFKGFERYRTSKLFFLEVKDGKIEPAFGEEFVDIAPALQKQPVELPAS